MHRLSVVILGMLTFIILVRIMPQNLYGIWMLFISISTVLEVLRNGLIRNPLVKYINTSDRFEYAQLTASSLYMNFFFTILTSCVLFLFSGSISNFLNAPQLDQLINIYILTNVILIPFSHFEFIQQANFQFNGTFVSYFLRSLFVFLYVLLCYVTDIELNLVSLAYCNAASVFFGAIASYFYARKFLTRLTVPNYKWLLKLFQYGKYTLGTNVNSILSRNIDHWLLGHLISPASVAIYNPAIRITNLVEVPTMALSSILFPKMAEGSKNDSVANIKRLYEKSIGAVLAFMIPITILIFVFAKYIVLIIAGDSYSESIPILRITILYALYIPFLRFFGNILDAVNRPHINFYFVLLLACANVSLNYIFISNFGVIGAAYGTTSAFGLAFVANQIYLRLNFKISTLGCLREAFKFYPLALNTLLHLITKQKKPEPFNP
jgi:O-antigen/teichoic acid export membrane protein